MELVLPSVEYRDSYIAALNEEPDKSVVLSVQKKDGVPVDLVDIDFAAYVESLKARAIGKGLPEGYIPDTRYWLVDSGEYIGRTSIRHSLTPYLLNTGGHIGYDIRPSMRRKGYGKKILELALPKARELGLDKVLLTCDETNEGSRKIIEANGGVFEDRRPNPEGGPDKLRYWINLA
jgi:predicted acetyltransferase